MMSVRKIIICMIIVVTALNACTKDNSENFKNDKTKDYDKQEQQELAKVKGAVEPIIELPTEMTEDKYKVAYEGFQMQKVIEEFEKSVALKYNKYYETRAWFYGTIMQIVELSKTTEAYIVEFKDECWYVVRTTKGTEKLCVGENIRSYGDCIGIKNILQYKMKKKSFL